MNKAISIKIKRFFTLLFVCFSLIAFSQTNETILKDSTSVKAPKAINTVNIIEEIEVASEKIKEIERKTKPSPLIKKIDSLYPTYKSFITTKRKQANIFIKSNPNKQKANNLLNEWKRYHDFLKSWLNTLNNNLEKNSIILEDVIFQEQTWNRTIEESKEKNIPSQIIKNIEDIKTQFENTKNVLIAENNKDLILESKINFQMRNTNDVIEKIENLKTSNIYNLFYKRHEALWNTPFKKSSDDGNEIYKKFSIGNISLEFLKTFEKTSYLFVFLVILIVLLINYLKKGYDIYPNIDDTNQITKVDSLVYNKSKVVVIFLSLFLAKILFRNVPEIINDTLTLALLFTTIPIINTFLSKKFKNIVYLIIIFFILNSSKTYIWFESIEYRLYLLFEAFLVISSLYYFTHPLKQLKTNNTTKITSLIIKLTPILYILAILSLISNIIGYTNLTDITLKICTQGVVLGIVFFGILELFDGVSLSVLHRHFNSKESFDFSNKINTETQIKKYNRLIVFIFWLVSFLSVIDFLNPLRRSLNDFLTDPYSVGSISFTIGSIVTFLLILISSFLITKLIAFLLDDSTDALKFLHLPKGIPAAISVVLRYLILGLGIIFAISSLGIDLSKFNLMAGALGLGIGFGLQNVISNFVSGLILIFERPILPGDTVEVNNLMGKVNKIGVRSSKVSTFDGADVVVPNSNLVSNDLINWTLSSNLKRIEILVGTSYDTDPNIVLELLLQCANSYPELIKDPAPKALFNDFGDSSLNFKLRFWVHFSNGTQAKSDVSIAIYNVFKEHGIEIPFPQQDVYFKNLPNQND